MGRVKGDLQTLYSFLFHAGNIQNLCALFSVFLLEIRHENSVKRVSRYASETLLLANGV
jgi:hypothetical protein